MSSQSLFNKCSQPASPRAECLVNARGDAGWERAK